ncbi:MULTISPECIES: hypothetical protein [Pantoea]|uniref:hypothetical protein n=1 Tax=Pantoea TaxID=53335 RepID=UPI000660B0AB|nr:MULTISPECIES: hypothetical protein [Pantoea]MBS6438591.1 hypothetical protein [Pantoea sp.]
MRSKKRKPILSQLIKLAEGTKLAERRNALLMLITYSLEWRILVFLVLTAVVSTLFLSAILWG